jgi:hypothetical protein
MVLARTQATSLNPGLQVPLGQRLGADHFEQVAKLNAVREIAHKVLNLHHALDQEGVAPARKRPLLNLDPSSVEQQLLALWRGKSE